ncbi:MAG: Cof-type HAD-IIB family hydrolase [bacterium]
MEKYLIAFDLDGTLLTDDKTITDTSKKYINKLIDDGHMVCIATGRPYAGMLHYYKELGLKTPIINTNGGMIHNPNDDNFKKIHLGMDKEIVKDIFSNNKDSILDAYFGYDHKVYFTSMHERLAPFIHIDENTILVEGPLEETIDVETSGVIVVVDENKHKNFEDYVNKHYSDKLALREFRRIDGTHLYELYHKAVSKREGLQVILDYYGLTSKNLIAFGDGDNDLEMLEFAYVGVAMVNGREEAIQSAKYITRTTNNEDGAILFLDHFLGYNTMD